MTEVRYVRTQNRLAKLLAQPGGTRISTLLERAALGVESLRETALLAIDRKIEDIAVFMESSDPHRFAVIRQYAGELFGDAGAFGLTEIALAARSLHDFLEFDQAQPSATALRVHLDAVRALRRPSVTKDKAAREAVLTALRELSQSFAAHATKISAEDIAGHQGIPPAGAEGLEANIQGLRSLVAQAGERTPVTVSHLDEPTTVHSKQRREAKA